MSRLQLLFIPCVLCVLTVPARAGERIDLSPSYDLNQITHVTIQLDAGGHNKVRPQQEGKSAAEEQSLPISVAAKLSYDEKAVAAADTVAAASTPLAVRYYDQAEAVIKVGETGRTPRLTDDKRLIVFEQGKQRPLAFCPDGPLSREQFDLIDVIGDSYAVNRLLPKQPVFEGESWSNDATVMGPLLTLDTIAVCEVQCVLDEFNDSYAKIRLAGDVQGTADGAASQQDVRGVYLFDRKLRRVTRLNLAVRERRSIGGATPGLDAVAKVQIKIEAIENSAQLTGDAINRATSAARTPLRDLSFESQPLGFRIKHDRQWYMTAERREAVTFRRVDAGDLVAQCSVTALAPKSAGRQTTLDQFQRDIQYSLGQNFGELVSSRQWQNAAGLYGYEVVARGLVEGLPVEWHYYLLAPESGHRISVAVTIEKPMLERVASSDRELVESLQLFPPMAVPKTAEQPATSTVK
jgi:hypothetical protein